MEIGKLVYATFFSFLIFTNSAWAWSYMEHAQLSYKSFDLACKELQKSEVLTLSEKDELPRYCSNSALRACYGHMVALSGDYTKIPDDLMGKKKNILKGKHLDCNCIEAHLRNNTKNNEQSYFEEKLVNGIVNKIIFTNLVSVNKTHFQPDSCEQWNIHTNKIKNKYRSYTDSNYLQWVFAEHAFSTHFLQDSFSAGHIGLKRDLHQDYGQAYHDDFNKLGQYIENDEDRWFTHGDHHLERYTHHIVLKGNESIELVTLIELLNKDLKNLDVQYSTFIDYSEYEKYGENKRIGKGQIIALKNITNSCSSEEDKSGQCKVFFLNQGLGHPLDNISTIDQFSLIDTHQADILRAKYILGGSANTNSCKKTETPSLGGYILSCQTTKHHVYDATVANIKILLMALLRKDAEGDQEEIDLMHARVARKVPHGYKKVRDFNPEFDNILTYGPREKEYTNVNSHQSLRYMKGGIYQAMAVDSHNDIDRFGTLAVQIEFNNKIDKSSKTFPAFSGAIELYNFDEDDYINGFEIMSYPARPRRVLRGLSGLSGMFGAGISNIWKGGTPLTYDLKIGGQLDFHFGKNILYFNLLGIRRNNNRTGADHGVEFRVGYALTNLSLPKSAPEEQY